MCCTFPIKANRSAVTYEELSETQVAVIKSEVQRYLAGTLDEITVRTMEIVLRASSASLLQNKDDQP